MIQPNSPVTINRNNRNELCSSLLGIYVIPVRWEFKSVLVALVIFKQRQASRFFAHSGTSESCVVIFPCRIETTRRYGLACDELSSNSTLSASAIATLTLASVRGIRSTIFSGGTA